MLGDSVSVMLTDLFWTHKYVTFRKRTLAIVVLQCRVDARRVGLDRRMVGRELDVVFRCRRGNHRRRLCW